MSESVWKETQKRQTKSFLIIISWEYVHHLFSVDPHFVKTVILRTTLFPILKNNYYFKNKNYIFFWHSCISYINIKEFENNQNCFLMKEYYDVNIKPQSESSFKRWLDGWSENSVSILRTRFCRWSWRRVSCLLMLPRDLS